MLMENTGNQKEHLKITHYLTASPLLTFACTSFQWVKLHTKIQYNLFDLELVLSLS